MDSPPPRDAERRLARVPGATYRLQFTAEFDFHKAAELVDYFSGLGITDIYISPPFQAAPGSTHGYDVCSYRELNPKLGGRADFDRLASRLKQHKMGLLLDMVPNHMGNDLSNPWWRDVLENGPYSEYADWFDIDWNPENPALHNKVLIPILEAPYAEVLENGKFKLVCEQGVFLVAYYERKFPLCPDSYRVLLEELKRTTTNCDAKSTLEGLLGEMPKSAASGPKTSARFASMKEKVAAVLASSGTLRSLVDELLGQLNGVAGQPRSFNGLHGLLEQQFYRLAWWRIGPEEINYRRFFDVTELVSARMELLPVFEAAHALVGELIADGSVSGLRIDHPDGLRAPGQYCQRLQERFGRATPFFIVVEKILSGDELLPGDWPVHGTTGYDFLNRLNGIFVDRDNEGAFERVYQDFTGITEGFACFAYTGKQTVLERSFVSELNALAARLKVLCSKSRYGQDLTLRSLRQALRELLAEFPVYRTYIDEATVKVPPEQEQQIQSAFTRAVARCPDARLACNFIRDLLLLRLPGDFDEQAKIAGRNFVMRLQQLSGPVMAKGVEDTAFYNYNRLVSLNEVGGEPAVFGTTVHQFHEYNRMKSKMWPHSLLATATHDTKRGEDTRARINVLSEIPDQWREAVFRWHQLNSTGGTGAGAKEALAPNDEYLFYQVLLGAWSVDGNSHQERENFTARLTQYMLKAARESKAHTSWTEPDKQYEAAVTAFIQHALRESDNPFLESFRSVQREVAWYGHLNSLAQVLLKLTSPGVPDVYQGTELWDFSLVDPDNRRPVDYELRRECLSDIQRKYATDKPALISELTENWQSGAVKLFLTWRILTFRKAHPSLFSQGTYEPLVVEGAKKEHVCAFVRKERMESCLSVAPRLLRKLSQGSLKLPLGPVWADTVLLLPRQLGGQRFENVLTGEIIFATEPGKLRLSDVLAGFPVALLQPVA